MTYTILLYSGLLTALCSALHGGNYFSKGWIIAFHTLFLPTAPLFWLFMRGSKQAKAELDYIDGKGSYDAIRKAYPLWLGHIIAPALRYIKLNPDKHFAADSNGHRTRQELAGGFICGVVIGIPLLVWELV